MRPLLARVLLSVGVLVVAVGVGILAGRLLRGAEAPSGGNSAAAGSVVVDDLGEFLLADRFEGVEEPTAGDLLPAPDRVVPVMAPAIVVDPAVDDDEVEAVLLERPLTPAAGLVGDGEEAGSPDQSTTAAPIPAIGFAASGVTGITSADRRATVDARRANTADEAVTTQPSSSTAVSTSTSPGSSSLPRNPPTSSAPERNTTATTRESVSSAAPSVERDAPSSAAAPVAVMNDRGVVVDIRPIEFDPCAGPSPTAGPVEGIIPIDEPLVSCDDGVSGTLFAIGGLPPMEVSIVDGHAAEPRYVDGLTCADPEPAGGSMIGTVWVNAPVRGVVVRYRPHGTSLEWTEILVDPPAALAENWRERWDIEEFDESWGVVPVCFTLPAAADTALDVGAVVSDTFGRLTESPPAVLGLGADRLRPPGFATMTGVSPVAHLSTWSTFAGSVVFRSKPVVDRTTDLTCDGARLVGDEQVWRAPISPTPDIYDPRFGVVSHASIPFETGGRLLVCAEVYDTDNTTRPLAIDRYLFEAPTQTRPEVDLRYVSTRHGGNAIDEGLEFFAGVIAGGEGPLGCDGALTVPPVADDEVLRLDEQLWSCGGPLSPLDNDGAHDLALLINRGRSTIVEAVIPIDAADCRTETCPQRTEWYDLPIPAAGQRTCFPLLGHECADRNIDGVAAIRVRYPTISGAGGRDGRITQLDRIDTTVLAATPRFTRPTSSARPGSDLLHWDATFEFQSDRPLRIAVETFELPSSGSACAEPARTEPAEVFATEFSITVPELCSNRSYGLIAHAEDEAGRMWSIDLRSAHSMPGGPKASFSLDLDVAAGDDWMPDEYPEVHIGPSVLSGPFFTDDGPDLDGEVLPNSVRVAPYPSQCFAVPGSYAPDTDVLIGLDHGDVAIGARLEVRKVVAVQTCSSVGDYSWLYPTCVRWVEENSTGRYPPLPETEPERTNEMLYRRVCQDVARHRPRFERFSFRFPHDAIVDLTDGEVIELTSTPAPSGLVLVATITRTSEWQPAEPVTLDF